MARIRSVKPGFFISEDVSELPLRARLTWIGLWTHCDDHGRTKDNVKMVKAAVWALDDVSLRDIEDDLNTLADRGRIVRYEMDGSRYLAVVNWHHHQNVNRPAKTKIPPPPYRVGVPPPGETGHCAQCWEHDNSAPPPPVKLTEDSLKAHGDRFDRNQEYSQVDPITEDSVMTHGTLTEDSSQDRNGKGWDRKGSAYGATRTRARELAATAHSPRAHTLIEAYSATRNRPPPATVRRKLARHVHDLLAEGWPDDLIARALTAWGDKGLDPAVLPSVANEVANAAPARASPDRPSTTDARVAAAQALKHPDRPDLRQLPGGAA